jgi:hypothetical protein
MNIRIASAHGAAWRQRFLAIARQVEAAGARPDVHGRRAMRPRFPARGVPAGRPCAPGIA